MNELHIYAAEEKPITMEPGQYGYTREFDSGQSYYREVFEGSELLWVIAHAVVCEV